MLTLEVSIHSRLLVIQYRDIQHPLHHTTGNLLARGERVGDTIIDLFKGWKIVSDVNFIASIELREILWIQGDGILIEILATTALNNYNIKMIRNIWGTQSKDQRGLVVLCI